LYCRFESGVHPREPVIDLLTVMQNHTSSLEDHGKQLSKTIGQVTQMIANAKATNAVLRMLPSSVMVPSSASATTPSTAPSSRSVVGQSSIGTGGQPMAETDFDKMERKFTDLRTTIVEKCQSSKICD
jgi:hypothetical protein